LRNQKILNTYEGYTGAFKHKFLHQWEKTRLKRSQERGKEKIENLF
jgi:hypothetical protein